MGPNRKTMPDGNLQYHFDGIKVRNVPLPLRVPLHQAQSQQQQSPQIKTLPTSTINNSIPTTTTSSTTSTTPGSPILTHLLYRKNNEAVAANNPADQPKVIDTSPGCKKDGGVNGSSNNILDGILSAPKKEVIVNEKSGLLASMLQEKKDQHLVNGEHEQYKKMNGSKRPASTEPDEVTAAKKPLIDATNGDSVTKVLQPIVAPEGSSLSTTGM